MRLEGVMVNLVNDLINLGYTLAQAMQIYGLD